MSSTHSAREPLEPAEELLRLWEQGARVDLEAFLAGMGALTPTDLAALVHVDQHHRWQLGERIAAESYLQRFPDVSTDLEVVVDVIFHEYLLRERLGECPGPQEYADRFPSYAEALESQIEFHRLLKETDPPQLAGQSAAATRSDLLRDATPDGAGQVQVGLVARDGLSSGREVQLLLRKRLRLLASISCASFLLYVPVLWTLFSVSWGTAIYLAVVAETAFIAIFLSGRRTVSLRSLRWIEACLFLGLLSFFGYQQVQFFQVGFYSALALDSWIGPAIAARSMSWPWAVTIISYGILIPNTARRCVAAIATMVVGFLAVTLVLAVTTSAPSSAAAGYALCSITDMAFAAAIAIFGAFRIQSLQRAVSEARKLGPYRLVRRLGSGGMGEVYLAEHALLRRPCALKLIRPEQEGDTHFLSRFEREVQTMATLTHPNTVRIYDYGLASDGTFYYAMEYLPGLSLHEIVARHGRLPAGRVVHLLRQVCEALREAHGVGLVHRDIKPANILACQTGGMSDVAKLLDFGLVRVQNPGRPGNSITRFGTIAGTPAFMSPEQAAGAFDVDQRSDIYSLGAVAYFLLTGQAPFNRVTTVETMTAHLREPVLPLGSLVDDVPADLEQVVLCCLEKDPERRFVNVEAVAAALDLCACSSGWNLEQAAVWWRDHSNVPPQLPASTEWIRKAHPTSEVVGD